MKIEDYLRSRVKVKLPYMGTVASVMVTYERPGLLTETVESYMASQEDPPPLVVFDDGSKSDAKRKELEWARTRNVIVMELDHHGFITTWKQAFRWAIRMFYHRAKGLILLEDDLSFAKGWVDVLVKMHDGAIDAGLVPGAMSCLRAHDEPQNAVVSLRGVEAYQSMMHGFQVNLVPIEVILRDDVFDESEKASRAGHHGIDVHWLGNMSHRLGRTNFVSMQSWVAHEGGSASVVEGQGYRSFKHRGFNLVNELER